MKKLLILLCISMASINTSATQTVLLERLGYTPKQLPTINDLKEGNARIGSLCKAELVEKEKFGNTVKLTYKMKEDQIDHSFEAGDFAKFYVSTINKRTGKIDPAYLKHQSNNPSWFNRTYSIASSETEYHNGELIVYYARVNDGYFNHYIDQAKPGSIVYLAKPNGKLRNSQLPLKKNQCYITTGTGIAPVISKLLSEPDKGNVEVYSSFKKYNDIIGEDILRNINPNIKLHITLTQEVKPGYLSGRLQNHIQNIDKENTLYYLVGGPDFVKDFENRLSNEGATVRTEGYPLSGQAEYPYEILDISHNDGLDNSHYVETQSQNEEPSILKYISSPPVQYSILGCLGGLSLLSVVILNKKLKAVNH